VQKPAHLTFLQQDCYGYSDALYINVSQGIVASPLSADEIFIGDKTFKTVHYWKYAGKCGNEKKIENLSIIDETVTKSRRRILSHAILCCTRTVVLMWRFGDAATEKAPYQFAKRYAALRLLGLIDRALPLRLIFVCDLGAI